MAKSKDIRKEGRKTPANKKGKGGLRPHEQRAAAAANVVQRV